MYHVFKKSNAKRLANLVRKPLTRGWWGEGVDNSQTSEEIVNQVLRQRQKGDEGMKCLKINKTGKKSHSKPMHTNEEVLREQHKGKLLVFPWKIVITESFSDVSVH